MLWLLGPFVLYVGALPLANRVRPVVLGLPFLFFWLLAATLLTPLCVWLAHRGDRKQRDGGRTQGDGSRTQRDGGRKQENGGRRA
ncbi:DUF3311 domain-containing protein [Streptomyces arenae]|nr:DUF3311 domain-containing protein [Streptomyces arenae]